MTPSIREYLRPGFVSWIPAIIAIAGAVSGGSGGGGGGGGGGSSGVPGAQTYVPTGQHSVDQSWQSIINGLMQQMGGQASTLTPLLNGALGSTSGLYQQLASALTGFGNQVGGAGSAMINHGTDLYGAGSQLWHDAQDPENALRDRTQQRVVDASRASTSARGIGTSGESAGMEDQAVSNFNLDWNDRMLGREIQGMQGMTGAYDAAGRQITGGASNLGASASMFREAGALPFELSNMYSGSMAGGVYDPLRNLLGNLQSYLGLGQSATGQSWTHGQDNMANLSGGLSTFFNSPGWSSIASNFSGGGGGSTGSGGSTTVDDTGWGGA